MTIKNHHSYQKEIEALQPYLVEVRRHIHANPEVGTDQPQTVETQARSGLITEDIHDQSHMIIPIP